MESSFVVVQEYPDGDYAHCNLIEYEWKIPEDKRNQVMRALIKILGEPRD